MGDHFLVGELVTLSALDDIVEDKDRAIVGRLKDQHILVLGFLVMKDRVDLQNHGLAGPPACVSGERGRGAGGHTCQRSRGTSHL